MAKKTKRPATVPTLPVPLPVNIPALPSGVTLTPSTLAALAREVAMDIKVLPDILKHYKITQEEYVDICKIPFYIRALEVATIEWNSALSTHDRLRIEAAASLEDALPGLSARMKNQNETFPSAIEAGKLFAKIAGLGEPDRSGAAAAEKFTISINLGADHQLNFVKEVIPVIEGSPSCLAPNINENEEPELKPVFHLSENNVHTNPPKKNELVKSKQHADGTKPIQKNTATAIPKVTTDSNNKKESGT